MRSNNGVNGINDLLGPGGGSKLVSRNAENGYKSRTDVKRLNYESDGVGGRKQEHRHTFCRHER